VEPFAITVARLHLNGRNNAFKSGSGGWDESHLNLD